MNRKKLGIIIIAIIMVILGIGAISGAFGSGSQTKTTWTSNLTTSTVNPETFNYIPLPNGTTSVTVEYSNLTNTTNSTSYFQFITLNFVPEQGQNITNYENNNIDLRTVSVNSTHPTGNLTLISNGAKSVGILDVSAKGTIKITAFS
jgi:hypothetical protein